MDDSDDIYFADALLSDTNADLESLEKDQFDSMIPYTQRNFIDFLLQLPKPTNVKVTNGTHKNSFGTFFHYKVTWDAPAVSADQKITIGGFTFDLIGYEVTLRANNINPNPQSDLVPRQNFNPSEVSPGVFAPLIIPPTEVFFPPVNGNFDPNPVATVSAAYRTRSRRVFYTEPPASNISLADQGKEKIGISVTRPFKVIYE